MTWLAKARRFNSADVAVITKVDLAEAAEFDASAANKNIQSVRPGMPVLRVSAKTGEGMDELLRFLASRVAESRPGGACNQLDLHINRLNIQLAPAAFAKPSIES